MSSGDLARPLEDRSLEAVDEFGSASFGLVAWELLTNEEMISPMWHQAIGQSMLRATGASDLGEPTYRLTLAGRTRLRDLRARSVDGRQPENSRSLRDP